MEVHVEWRIPQLATPTRDQKLFYPRHLYPLTTQTNQPTAMDAFNMILSYFVKVDAAEPVQDLPVESDSGSNSNGGSCTVA